MSHARGHGRLPVRMQAGVAMAKPLVRANDVGWRDSAVLTVNAFLVPREGHERFRSSRERTVELEEIRTECGVARYQTAETQFVIGVVNRGVREFYGFPKSDFTNPFEARASV